VKLHIDVETRCVVDLPKANAYVYFDHPSADIWLLAWAFDDEEPQLWFPGQPVPLRVAEHVLLGGLVYGWNVAFERLAWRRLLTPRYGWPEPDLEQYRCVMAAAYAVGLPGKLEQCAPAIGLAQEKDMEGKALMLRMSKTRKARKGEDPAGVYWWDEPEKLARLGEYCKADVRAEAAIDARIPPLSDSEQRVWFLDQRANDRGVYVDEALCLAGQRVVEAAQARLDEEMRRVTDLHVRGVSNVAELVGFCRERGVDAESVKKDELADLLVRDDLPPDVRRALNIRQEGAKTSTAKIAKLLATRQADGRMRGNLQYHGATTGRWAARGAQLQNLPRPALKVTPAVLDNLMLGDAELLEMLYGETFPPEANIPPVSALSVVSDCIRSMITAGPGHRLLAADYSQIEARMTAWLAGEQHVLKAFVDADNKAGPDVYIVSAAGIYRVSPDSISKEDPRRQVGKVSDLSFGFGGGAMALLKMAKNYRLDIADTHDAVMASATAANIRKAEEAWEARGKASGVMQRRWLTAEVVKLGWRDSHPATVAYWKACNQAAVEAVENPGLVTHAGRLRYRKHGSWLFCRLPSGRLIAYAFPSIDWREAPWTDDEGKPAKVKGMSFFAVDSFTKKWSKQHFYGGLAVQNPVQAAARDVMAESMLAVDAAGYTPVLTIHDEVVAEAPVGFGSFDEFVGLMKQPRPWMDGLPIAADGWEGKRYRK
jgi:DNA polymerase